MKNIDVFFKIEIYRVSYVSTIRCYLSYTSTPVMTFSSLIYSRGGAAYVRLTKTASTRGIHTTTVLQYDANMIPRRIVGPARDNIHATVRSTTWNTPL